MHLVGFIIRIYHDAQSSERQMRTECKDARTEHRNNCVLISIKVFVILFKLTLFRKISSLLKSNCVINESVYLLL